MNLLNSDSCTDTHSNEESARSFSYSLLGRYQRDCEYFLGAGCGHLKHLYFDTIDRHIDEMKKLHNWFQEDAKPEWLSLEEITAYGQRMNALVLAQSQE